MNIAKVTVQVGIVFALGVFTGGGLASLYQQLLVKHLATVGASVAGFASHDTVPAKDVLAGKGSFAIFIPAEVTYHANIATCFFFLNFFGEL